LRLRAAVRPAHAAIRFPETTTLSPAWRTNVLDRLQAPLTRFRD
jgi:hypothetical protein